MPTAAYFRGVSIFKIYYQGVLVWAAGGVIDDAGSACFNNSESAWNDDLPWDDDQNWID